MRSCIDKSKSIIDGNFPLNPNTSDRITFSADLKKDGSIKCVNNITYMMLYQNTWEWIIRYDDHGGNGDFHGHERVSLEDDSDFPFTSITIPHGTKLQLFQWAISDIRKNYIVYRDQFCHRNGIDLY